MYPKVSIIIPVYNVEYYIESCIFSVLKQSYENLECLIIDDFSPDNSIEIVKNLISRIQSNIEFKILKHTRNKGLSEARNTGINNATGEYIYFLDSDDEILDNTISDLVDSLSGQYLDFVIGNYILKNKEESIKVNSNMTLEIYLGNKEIIKHYYSGDWNMMGCNKLLNLSFIINSQLYFPVGLLHEDELWCFKLACLSCSMGICQKPTYIYKLRTSSITNYDFSLRVPHLIEILSRMIIFVSSVKIENPTVAKLIINKFSKELLLKSLKNNVDHETLLSLYKQIRSSSYFITSNFIKTFIYGMNTLLPFNLGYTYYKYVLLLFNRRLN